MKKLLSEQIEKSIGISPPQETYIRNIDSGLALSKAKQDFLRDNKKYLIYMQTIKKDPFFILYSKFNLKNCIK